MKWPQMTVEDGRCCQHHDSPVYRTLLDGLMPAALSAVSRLWLESSDKTLLK
jgi:hypothetical protein